ncbi:MAG TPA: polysaccharide biosynthesis/export family protein [Blastocatellia bacterium]|nr:polysaccharide biosynthesis/export family protein [Blastocatellia bacterium]
MKTGIGFIRVRYFELGRRALLVMLAVFISGAAKVSSNQEGRPPQTEPPSVREDASKNSTRPAVNSSVFVASSEDYRIGPSDVLDIKIEDAPELSGPSTVSESGVIELHFLGKIMAKEKTPEELAGLIAEALRKAEYLKNPRVVVTVSEYNSRSFYILGSVRNPGVYKIKGKADMLTLIVLAGGLPDSHGSTAFIFRRDQAAEDTADPANPQTASSDGQSTDGNGYQLQTANISGLMKGILKNNLPLQPGDIVNIPPPNVFFVGGEVLAPGSFPLKEGTTLRQAISMAQGMTFKAAPGRGVIFREDPATGQQQEIRVDISAVMSNKKPDIPLKANDIIVVPDSRLKAVGGALLSAFGMATVNRGAVIR